MSKSAESQAKKAMKAIQPVANVPNFVINVRTARERRGIQI